ncbi:MAG TPA: hypothetical protein PLQ45_07930 [Anaerohalosphaeraceae bacterium]|nr:hypothetical protein [Anaerohalosphaeraceae bacterium]
MKSVCFILCLAVVSFYGLGCQELPSTPASPEPEGPRLKLSDLAPSDQSFLSVQCVFSVIFYRLTLDKLPQIPDTLSMLNRKTLIFADPEGFAANGFWAASGLQPYGSEVVAALGQLGAERIGIKKLFLFEDYPEEIVGFPVEMGQSVFYFQRDGMIAGKRVPGGRLSLSLRGKPDTPSKGFALLQIDTVFQPTMRRGIPSQTKTSLYENIYFREGRLQTTLAEGDFLVFTSTKTELQAATLTRLLADTRGKEPGVLLCLIVCQKAGEL